MNVLQEAVSRIRHAVPQQILEDGFIDEWHRMRGLPVSLDTQIINKVIRPRVMADINLVGGTEMTVPLNGLQTEIYDAGRLAVYSIPKKLTHGRNITNPLHVQHSALGTGTNPMGTYNSNYTMSTARGLLKTTGSIPVTSTARVRLIAENTILVENATAVMPNSYLRCIVEHDESLSGIKPPSYPVFFQLVEYAVKAYLYNTLMLSVDQGRLSGGRDLGVYRDILSEYSDANENYKEYLDRTWAVTSLLDDEDSKRRAVNVLMPGWI